MRACFGATLARPRQRGSVLVGLLWCLALLSVITIGVLHSARLDLRVTKNYGDSIQAHYLAVAGIEKAKALLFQDARERQHTRRNHTGTLENAPEHFQNVTLGRGQFRVVRPARAEDGGRVFYGISDEESRLNLNQATAEQLMKLYGMTPDVVSAIIDWRDEDNTVSPNGAESEYYAALQPPRRPRNGSFPTIQELLMVRGVTPELLWGADGEPEDLPAFPEAGSGDLPTAASTGDPRAVPWGNLLTVDSSVRNQNSAGEDRVNVQSADEKSLTSVRGITTDLAKAIIASRGQNRLESLADLLELTAVNPSGLPNPAAAGPVPGPIAPGQPVPGAPSPARDAASSGAVNARATGPKLISEDLLMDIADDVTTVTMVNQPGAININTASAEVLLCLTGISRELAQAIVAYRKSAGFFSNVARLLRVDGMSREIFKQVASQVTVRSETFRIVSEGKVNGTGARKRLEAFVRLAADDIETISYREDP